MLAHNGEINTLLGNVNWQRALDAVRPISPLYLPCISRASPLYLPLHPSYQVRGRRAPLVSLARSDSANLDAVG